MAVMEYGTINDGASNQSGSFSSISGSNSRDCSQELPKSREGLSMLRSTVVIASLSGVTFASSISSGLLTVGLPLMAKDLNLPKHLLVWPYSVYSLATCCCLLLAGSIADLIGDRIVNLIGTLIVGCCILSTSLATDGLQLILFRGLQGIGVSMCLPTGVSIMTRSFPRGRRRTFGFSCLGLAQPVGYSLGLVGEGLFQAVPGRWRLGWLIAAGIVCLFFLGNCWALPGDEERIFSLKSLKSDIDWVGVLIASSCLGSLSYVSAMLNEDPANMYKFQNIALLTASIFLAFMFVFWMASQARNKRPALIPNSLWRKKAFTAICIMVFLAWAALQGIEVFTSLFFQEVQGKSAALSSLQLLPNTLSGVIVIPLVGLFVQNVSAYHLLLSTSVISSLPPLIMAVINPMWSFWSCSFWAVLLGPVSADVIFTVAHLIVTDTFPPNTHALAGAVFNTIAQLGTSVGLSIMALASHHITENANDKMDSPAALMLGYRAAFWAAFIMMIFSCVAAVGGLRGIGKLGGALEKGKLLERDEDSHYIHG